MSRAGIVLAAAALAVAAALPVAAQKRPEGRPTRPATSRPGAQRPSTTPRAADRPGSDSVPDQLVEWVEPDSVMQSLLEAEGFTVTRYQGTEVVFRVRGRELQLRGKAVVERKPTLLVSDTIIYQDSARRVIAFGFPSVLRDPSQQSADLVARGRLEYNLETKRAIASNVSTAVEAGERWFVVGEKTAPVLADSATGQESAFYARHGEISSCDLPDSLWHYHFSAREIKMVSKKALVARPAVLYIADIPVMWLPFIYKSLAPGRQSGLLTPRFGVSELVRNSPTYRRHIENLGYYWAVSDYFDAQATLDWRSGARPSLGDPGWMRTSSRIQYRWLDRFVTGSLAGSHMAMRDGSSNTTMSWQHAQEFSLRRSLNANLNYATNTTVQRRTATHPVAVFATILSQLTYRHDFSRFASSIGGTRTQYPGRTQVDQTFPTFNLTTRGPITVGRHLVWTPTFNLQNSQIFKNDQTGGIAFRFLTRPDGGLDSTRIERNSRQTTARFDTPLELFGFRLSNSFSAVDALNDFPDTRVVYGPDSGQKETRVFRRTYRTKVDWSTSFGLPTLLRGSWNLSPSIGITDVDPSGFLVRTEISGTRWVRGEKRLTYSIGAAPTFYGLFPGIGPVTRFRHAISPTLSYSYAPAKTVSAEYLRANGRDPATYLGSLRQNQMSLGLSTNLEAKLRQRGDTNPEGGRKVKVLALNFDALAYDFERERKTGQGFTTNQFGYGARSDLLPGVDVRVGYSLFQGDPLSDTAEFKPYRESVSASFQMNRRSNPIALLTRIFGRAVPTDNPAIEQIEQRPEDRQAQQLARQQLVGGVRNPDLVTPTGQGWQATFSYSFSKPRPPVGDNVVDFDPRTVCDDPRFTPIERLACRSSVPATGSSTLGFQTSYGATQYRRPPTHTLQSTFSFNVTPRWGASWNTTYDFEERQFASHTVQLTRELHDWQAVFGFVQAPNGNFAFTFFIALKAEPQLKFDYNKQSYRRTEFQP